MIGLVSTYITAIIVIPKHITEYLFNSDEEKYMSEVMKIIVEYDADVIRDSDLNK